MVLFLIGLFSALLVPRLDRFGQGELDAAARRLRGTIKFVFNEAALTGREHRLVCDLKRGTYRAMVLQPDGQLVELPGVGSQAHLPNGIRFQDLSLRGRGTFSAGEITLRIHPTGWLEETVIHLRDQAGVQRTVITSYSIHYTKLYDEGDARAICRDVAIAPHHPVSQGSR